MNANSLGLMVAYWLAHRLAGFALAAALLAVLLAPVALAGVVALGLGASPLVAAYGAALGAPVSWWLARRVPRAWLGALLRCWAWPDPA